MGESTDNGPGRHPQVSDEELLRVFRQADTPVLTTQMAADELPITKRAVLDRLKSLHSRGRLEKMDVGPRAQVWWISDEDEDESDEPDYLAGFGAAAGTDFGERVREAHEELGAGFRDHAERHAKQRDENER